MCKCRKMLQPYVDWCNQPSTRGEKYYLQFQMSGLDQNRFFVSYSVGTLTLQEGKFLQGDGTSTFSDRTWSPPPVDGIPSFEGYPFDPSRLDSIGLQIDVETGQTKITLHTWGDVEDTADLRCANGVLYGFFNQGANPILISLKTAIMQAPPR